MAVAFLAAILAVLVFYIYNKLYIRIRNFRISKQVKENFNREIDTIYSPSIISIFSRCKA